MVTIGVIGSCVSRDLFNKLFVKDHRKYFDCCMYQHQMSMISLVAKPIPYDEADLNDHHLTKTNFEHFKSELDKSALPLIKKLQPQCLLIDFYADTLYGAVEIGDSYITGKLFKFRNSKAGEKLVAGKALFPRKDFMGFFEVWKPSFDKFMEFMKENAPDTKIIINQAKTSSEVKDLKTGEISHFGNYKIDELNFIWGMLDTYAIETYHLDSIDYGEKKYFLDPEYPLGTGLGIVHYHKDFYEDSFEQLLKITQTIQDEK